MDNGWRVIAVAGLLLAGVVFGASGKVSAQNCNSVNVECGERECIPKPGEAVSTLATVWAGGGMTSRWSVMIRTGPVDCRKCVRGMGIVHWWCMAVAAGGAEEEGAGERTSSPPAAGRRNFLAGTRQILLAISEKTER